MKFASLVLSGSLLVVLAGCSSDGDSGRVSTLTEELALTQEELETAEAALETAQSQRDAARNTLTTTQTELDEAEEDLGTAQTQLTTAQQEAAAQQVLAQEAQQEETSAEIITRAFGLLEAMDEAVRADSNNPDPANERIFAASVLGSSHPLEPPDPVRSPRISNNAPNIRQNAPSGVQLNVMQDLSGEFTRGGGIPSLSLGGRSLSSTLLENTTPLGAVQEMAIYTDFRTRDLVLLDHYDDERRVVTGVKQNEINVANTSSADTISVNEKMREDDKTGNAAMYANLDEVLALNARPSGVTLGSADYPLVRANYSVAFESEQTAGGGTPADTTDDEYNNTVIHHFPASFRGVNGRLQNRNASTFPTTMGVSCQASPSHADCTAGAAAASIPAFEIVTVLRSGSTNAYEPASYDAQGNWTFRPGSATVRINIDDEHYLYFGWWQETPDEADGVYDFHVLTGSVGSWEGAPAHSLKQVDNVVYTGPAVGKYVRTISAHDELDHAGERRRDAVDGIFTASVRLEADFNATDQVKGTITNFQDGGQAIPGNWQVILIGGTTPPEDGSDAQTFANFTTNPTNEEADLNATLMASGVALIKQGGQAGAIPEEDPSGRRMWNVQFMADERTQSLTGAMRPSLPPSAVGAFDVGLEEIIHFSGAFGVATTQQ